MEEALVFFNWVCSKCSNKPRQVQVGVSSGGHLVARWYCATCQRPIIAMMPLDDVIAAVPSKPQPLLEAATQALIPELTQADENLLKKAKIAW